MTRSNIDLIQRKKWKQINYFWIRIFDYQYEKIQEELLNASFNDDVNNKGTLLDEYYLSGDTLIRDECKLQVKKRSKVSLFAKPRKNKNGIYALVIDSDKFFYDRFYKTIDTYCFNCGKHIEGHAKDFPNFQPFMYDPRFDTDEECNIKKYDQDTRYYFCSYDCKSETLQKLRGDEGEWQVREDYTKNGGVFGYIYHIYNRKENKHYIGQTRYMPFFRWQEHAKQHIKGDICDLVFETVAEIRKQDQEYLNNIEAWWIQKYIVEYGKENVMNITVPKITIDYLVDQFENTIKNKT